MTLVASPVPVAPAITPPNPASPVGPRAGRPKARKFPDAYKRRIVAEYDDADSKSDKGAILRRERLYSSHITNWRNAINSATDSAPKKRGRPADSEEVRQIKDLESEVAALKAKLEAKSQELDNANKALEILGKGVAFLEMLSSKNAK
jgi:transposase